MFMAKKKSAVTVTAETTTTPHPDSDVAKKFIKKAVKKAGKGSMEDYCDDEGNLDIAAVSQEQRSYRKKVAKKLAQHKLALGHLNSRVDSTDKYAKGAALGVAALIGLEAKRTFWDGPDNDDQGDNGR